MGFIWALIVGGVIGAIAGAITKKGSSMGIIANIIAGLVGSTIGQAILGTWGPSLAGMAIVPSIIGAVILVAIVSWIFRTKIEKIFSEEFWAIVQTLFLYSLILSGLLKLD